MALIVWTIVKWIVWILVFLLLFLLIVAALLLFVPIRYRIHGKVEEKKPDLTAKATWLLHLVSVHFTWNEGTRLRLRIFGLPVFDSLRAGKKKKSMPPEEETEFVPEPLPEVERSPKPEPLPEVEKSPKPECIPEVEKKPKSEQMPPPAAAAPKKNMLNRLREKLLSLKSKLTKIGRSAADIKATADRFLTIWKQEETQAAFALCRNTIGKVVKAILPKKWSVTGNVGFEDPSVTGYLMAGLGIGYPFLGNHIRITPDFEHSVLQLEGRAKGRIRIFTLIRQVIRVVANRNCRRLFKLISSAQAGQNREVEKHG